MTRWLRDFRLVPIVLIAISSLFILKSLGLILNGAYTLGDDGDITGSIAPRPDDPLLPPAPARPSVRSWAQQMFNFPDITGSVPAPKEEAKAKPKATPASPPPGTGGVQVPLDGGRVLSPAERAVLERLAERRAELDTRAKELEMRENLVQAAEKRLESRLAQLKQLETQINEAARIRDENDASRIKNLITMYENMKAKDAARVFDRLDMRILIEVATQINPRRMSDILAQMLPEVAERLTVELATRAKDRPLTELPKIVGRPSAN